MTARLNSPLGSRDAERSRLRARFIPILVLLALLPLAPLATAQTDVVETSVAVVANASTTPAVPGTDVLEVALIITYSWGNGGVVEPNTNVDITLTAEAPAAATVTLDPTTVSVTGPTVAEGSSEGTAKAFVTLSAEAVGLTDIPIKIIANAPATGNLKASSGETTFNVQAAAVMAGNATAAPSTLVVAAGDAGRVTLMITNDGNVPVTASLNFTNVPEGLTLKGPATAPVINARPEGLPNTGPVDFDYNVTGLASGNHTVFVTVTLAAPGGSPAITQTVNVSFVVLGSIEGEEGAMGNFLPGPSPLAFLLAAGAAVLLAGGRRRQ